MWNFIHRFLDFFSPYANKFEKKIDQFIGKLSSSSSSIAIAQKITEFIQADVVSLNLWLERRYKAYIYLHKSQRQELYVNTQKMLQDFYRVSQSNPQSPRSPDPKILNQIFQEIKAVGGEVHQMKGYERELQHLYLIMRYFSPAAQRFVYRESSNFGSLLHDPTKNQLIGDCNQIVTLYIHFFAQYFPVKDLNIKTYPGHVCLHFRGVDIEATNGEFAVYQESQQKVLPISEIISVNLLDTTDSSVKKGQVSPKAFLEAAKLAHLLSSEKSIVAANLKAAYHNLAFNFLKENKPDLALDYAKQSQNQELIKKVAHNSVVFFLERNNFAKAQSIVHHTQNPKLQQEIIRSEGIYYFNKQDYQSALSRFQKVNDQELIKKCFAGLYFQLQKKIQACQTVEQLKSQRSTIYKLKEYAQKAQDPELINHANDLISQI